MTFIPDAEYEEDPYSETAVSIKDAIEWGLHPDRRDRMNDYEFEILQTVATVLNYADRGLNIDIAREE